MLSNTLELRAQGADYGRGVGFLLQEVHPQRGRVGIGTLVTMASVDEGAAASPTFSLTWQSAQLLLDDLWRAGFRPSNEERSAGQLGATEKHLAAALEANRRLQLTNDRLLDRTLDTLDTLLLEVTRPEPLFQAPGPAIKYARPEVFGTVTAAPDL